MYKAILLLAVSSAVAMSSAAKYSTTSVVTLVGAKILSSQEDLVPVEKYKRKDCPVCKGKGWYISGDGIAKVDCGYCEPEEENSNTSTQPIQKDPIIIMRK